MTCLALHTLGTYGYEGGIYLELGRYSTPVNRGARLLGSRR